MGRLDQARGGFTLIELSIVLVIIGLIVGGVLVGRNLIRTAELNSIITDETRYVTAVNTFRTKYNELPGDMVDATTYWGTDPGTCPNLCAGATCYTTPQTTTCNGNGNGLIENDGTGTTNTQPAMWENFRAWQQLADAGLIPGGYTGTPGPGSWTDNEPGLNVPATKLSGGGFEWEVFNQNASGINPALWNAQFDTQYLLLGKGNVGTDLVGSLLPPPDALAIDSKMDDGLPTSGDILAPGNFDASCNCGCLNGPGTKYATSVTIQECTLLFAVKSW